FVLGGAKISDAFLMMETVLKNSVADTVLTGGLVANIMLAANGEEIGSGSREFIHENGFDDFIEDAKQLLTKYPQKIVLPSTLAYIENGQRKEAPPDLLPADAAVLDIGSQTARHYADIIKDAKTVFVNGPMGVFENPQTQDGTKIVWDALAQTEGYTVIGGGDSITATAKYDATDRIDYICTGGGALIRFLSGEELPVVKALRYAAEAFK
ncbi:MAG: phosphoglycerate kinase, partial [Clostridiales bacterium]|nr:phosphoglycerate kinase [Clostridiales bacterium]